MKRKILIISCIIFLTGCFNIKLFDEDYIEKSKTYTVGNEKIIKEYVPEKKAYKETKLSGKTTSWGLKSKYIVGKGKNIEPGVYNIETKGWANYNIFIGAVELNLDYLKKYSGSVRLGPLSVDVCYINEISCTYNYSGYKTVQRISLEEGDVIYTSYEPFNGQSVSIRFKAQYVTINHPKQEAQPEIKVMPLVVKETIRKYSKEYKCYINDYEVSTCESLNYYEEIIKQFE